MNKVDYVKQQAKTNTITNHTCHWPGCTQSVPPAMWGCKRHWFMLPKNLRDKIWEAYKPGQEIKKNPTKKYIKVVQEVQKWIAANHPGIILLPTIKKGKK